MKCQNGISKTRGGDRTLPYAFTEHGISMLAGLLRSPIAIAVNIRIIRAFVELRKIACSYQYLFERIGHVEHQQKNLEHKVENALYRICNQDSIPKQGIFYDGQIYDAYTFIAELIRKAENRIVLIDNYIDDTVLTLLNKRKDRVPVTIYTEKISKELQLDIEKHNAQYPSVEAYTFKKAHDRFMIIDDEVYLIGASIKDLGKKWFGFTLIKSTRADELIGRLQSASTH